MIMEVTRRGSANPKIALTIKSAEQELTHFEEGMVHFQKKGGVSLDLELDSFLD